MREEKKSLRQQQIEDAAYEVLEAKGYDGTSMLGIARQARASNETLYNWYGDKQGLFQVATGGTLFLDEVADLPLAMQVKLLRAIQEKAVRPVGGSEELGTDIRILSATHKDLAAEVAAGHFRNDLYYRINVIDLLLGVCRADDAYYSQLLVDKFLFMTPEDQLVLRDCMRRGAACVHHPYRAGPFFITLPLNTQPELTEVNLTTLPAASAAPAVVPASADPFQAAIGRIAASERPVANMACWGSPPCRACRAAQPATANP